MMLLKYGNLCLLFLSTVASFSMSPRSMMFRPWHDPLAPLDPGTHHAPLSLAVSPDAVPSSHFLVSSISQPMELSTPILLSLVFVALAIGVLANGWISRLLSGDQGLASFLSDGSGYNKSSFKPLKKDSDRAVQSDPLPWLKLPQLDFVEVAGQASRKRSEPTFPPLSTASTSNNSREGGAKDEIVIAKLELIRREMQEQLQSGNTNEAERLRSELERLMNGDE